MEVNISLQQSEKCKDGEGQSDLLQVKVLSPQDEVLFLAAILQWQILSIKCDLERRMAILQIHHFKISFAKSEVRHCKDDQIGILLFKKKKEIIENYLHHVICLYKIPVVPCPSFLPNCLMRCGDAHFSFGLQWGSQTSDCLANEPCWASRSCPQSQESEWAESPSPKQSSCPDCNLQFERQGLSSTATGSLLKDDSKWRNLTFFFCLI